MSVLHAPVRSRPGNSPAGLWAALAVLLVFGLPANCFGIAALRKLSPGFGSNCGPDPYTGNVMLTFADPTATRGWPLMNNINLNTQVAENRLLGNATFSYDIHVKVQTIYINGVGSAHYTVVDGTGRILDFGPAYPPQIAPEHGVFSSLSRVFDANNVVIGYTLSNAGPPESVHRAGNFTYNFDVYGKLTSLADPMGNTQTLAYSTYQGAPQLQITDTNTGKAIKIFPGSGSYFIYHGAFDGVNWTWANTTLVSFTSAKVTSILTYGASGSVLARADFTYDSNGNLYTYKKDLDPATQITHSYTQLLSVNGTTNVFMANQQTPGYLEGTTHYHWGVTPPTGYTDTVSSDSNTTPVTTTYFDFNTQGDCEQIRLPTLTGATAATIYKLSYANRVLTSLSVCSSNTSDPLHTYSITPTGNGLPQFLTDPRNHTWTWNWQGADLLSAIDPLGTLFSVQYYGGSLPHFASSVTDSGNNTWNFSPFSQGTNLYGQVSQIVPPPGSQFASTFSYYGSGTGSGGLLSSFTDGNGNHVDVGYGNNSGYDILGDLGVWVTNPGTQNGSPAQEVFALSYDYAQRPTVFQQPDNRTINWNYYSTALGRNTRNLDHTVDEAGTQVNYTWCPFCGALESVSCGAWGLSWQDDANGNIIGFTKSVTSTTTATTSYTYGSAGELITITYPDSANDKIQLQYDNYGRVSQVTDPRSNVFTLGYDNADNLTTVSGAASLTYDYNDDNTLYAGTNSNGTTRIYPDPVTRQPTKVTYTYTGLSNVQELDYNYNPDGSRHTLTWKNGTATVGVWTYAYDPGGRLLTVTNSYNETTKWFYEGDDKLDWQQNANGTWNGLEYTGNGGRDWPTQVLNFSNSGGLGYFGELLADVR